MGVTLMLGLQHLWMVRRPNDAHAWVAVWSLVACLFLGARGVQLTTTDPAAALFSGKLAIAAGPFLVWAIVGFSSRLNESALPPALMPALSAMSALWALGIFTTDAFVDPVVTTRSDFFGREHFSVHARPPIHFLNVYLLGIFIWGVRRLRRGSALASGERRVLIAGFSAYALLGVCAILTTADLISIPSMAEYGPVVVAISLSHLLVQRGRRIEVRLEDLLIQQSTRLAASEARYRDWVYHAPLGILACDEAGRIATANPRMTELLEGGGLAADPDVSTAAAASLPAVLMEGAVGAGIRRASQDRTVVRVEQTLEASGFDHAFVWQVTIAPLEVETEGESVLVLVDDATERSRLGKQLQQAQKMDSIGQLTAGIAHEINNPMAYVRANLGTMDAVREDLASVRGDCPKSAEALVELEMLIGESIEGVERTISIVRDMREFSFAGEHEECASDLAPILDACTRVAEISHSRGARIHLDLPEAVEVVGASGPLRQVFLNLLVNALQALPGEGNVWMTAVRRGAWAHVCVEDDGPGVADGARSQLFDPFFTTKREGEGTGLGLYISHEIVRSYGGDIAVGDRAGGGARFEVRLPVAPAATPPSSAPDPRPAA